MELFLILSEITMAPFWKVVAATVGAIGTMVTLNRAYQKYQTANDLKLEAKKKAVAVANLADDTNCANWCLQQGTFWNRAEICHSILFRRIQVSFGLRSDSTANMLAHEGSEETIPFVPFPICTPQTGISFPRWNLADGTFEMKTDGKTLGKPKTIQYRVISLSERSVRVMHRLLPNVDGINGNNDENDNSNNSNNSNSLNSGSCAQGEFDEHHQFSISLWQTANFTFPQERVEAWKKIHSDDWRVDISELLDPTKTTAAEFQNIFDQSTSCSTTVELIFDCATQLPTVLRKLSLDYAN